MYDFSKYPIQQVSKMSIQEMNQMIPNNVEKLPEHSPEMTLTSAKKKPEPFKGYSARKLKQKQPSSMTSSNVIPLVAVLPLPSRVRSGPIYSARKNSTYYQQNNTKRQN